MVIRTVVVSVVASALVIIAPVTTRADDPDALYYVCFDNSDRERLAAEREACDIAAESAGYSHGVLRPQNPSDGAQIVCVADPPWTTYWCDGVGGR